MAIANRRSPSMRYAPSAAHRCSRAWRRTGAATRSSTWAGGDATRASSSTKRTMAGPQTEIFTHSLTQTHSLTLHCTHTRTRTPRGLNPATRGARAKRSPRNTRTRHAPGPGQRKPRTPPTDACRLQDSRVDRRRAQACGGSRAGASVRGSLSLRARPRGVGDAGGVEPAPPPRGTQRRTRAHHRMTTVSSTSSFCRRRRRRLLRGALGSPSAVKARGERAARRSMAMANGEKVGSRSVLRRAWSRPQRGGACAHARSKNK